MSEPRCICGLGPNQTCGRIPCLFPGVHTAVSPLPGPPFLPLTFPGREAELATSYPDDNPKTVHGVKKTPLHLIPPPALEAEAWVFALGAAKYGAYNWRKHRVSASVYQAAALRHVLAWWNGESTDAESGQSHLAHARACLGILLDAEKVGKLNDDRPISGALAAEREPGEGQ